MTIAQHMMCSALWSVDADMSVILVDGHQVLE